SGASSARAAFSASGAVANTKAAPKRVLAVLADAARPICDPPFARGFHCGTIFYADCVNQRLIAARKIPCFLALASQFRREGAPAAGAMQRCRAGTGAHALRCVGC